MSQRRGCAAPVGMIPAGRRKYAYSDGPVSVGFKMDPAVHFALRLVALNTGLEQQYLINMAVSELCKQYGIDPDVVRARRVGLEGESETVVDGDSEVKL